MAQRVRELSDCWLLSIVFGVDDYSFRVIRRHAIDSDAAPHFTVGL
jgi:hypothetical protein